MRFRKAPTANRSKGFLQASSMGVLTDAKSALRAVPARIQKPAGSILKRLFPSAHLSKRKRKHIQSTALFAAMLVGFSLFSICFGDAVFSPEDLPALQSVENGSALALAPVADFSNEEGSAKATTQKSAHESEQTSAPESMAVFYSASGSRYHLSATCSGMKDAKETDLSQAKAKGLTPCKRCNPPE